MYGRMDGLSQSQNVKTEAECLLKCHVSSDLGV